MSGAEPSPYPKRPGRGPESGIALDVQRQQNAVNVENIHGVCVR